MEFNKIDFLESSNYSYLEFKEIKLRDFLDKGSYRGVSRFKSEFFFEKFLKFLKRCE